jgi:hypothetical protein
MSNPTVWVVKEQVIRGEPMDYTLAMDFGDLEFITRNDLPLHSKSTVQDVWNRDVMAFCQKYDEARDFIVCTGQPSAIFHVGFALGLVRKSPRFLVWRREQGRYVVVAPGAIAYTPSRVAA